MNSTQCYDAHFKKNTGLSVVLIFCYLSAWSVADGSGTSGQCCLHNKFKACLNFMRLSLKTSKKNTLEKEWAMNSGLYLYFKLSWGRRLLVDQTFFVSCWPGNSQRSPRQCRLLESLVDSQKLGEWDYIAEESYTLHTGLRKVMIELKWKLPPCWLHFIVLDVSLQATEGKKKKHHFQLSTTCDNIKLPSKTCPLVK